MAFGQTSFAADKMSADGRCVVCRDGLDRLGRYCAKCLRSRRLKLFFATVVAAQCAGVGFYIMQSRAVTRVVPSDGQLHTVAVSSPVGQTGWYYFDVTDPLIEDVTHHARIIADTPLAPKGVPASPGATSGTLNISFSRHYGKSVILTFPTVPHACLANVCELRAVFDSDGPQVLAYQDVSSHGVTVFMLAQPADFLKRLPSAHGLTFIATLGTLTDTTITFDVQGFRLSLASLSRYRRLARGDTHQSAVRVAARPGAPPGPG